MTMRNHSRRKRFINKSKDIEDSMDKSEKFILKKCITYLQRHFNRYPILNEETLDFLCWVMGDMKKEISE